MNDEAPPPHLYEVPAGQAHAIRRFVAGVPEAEGVLASHLSDHDQVLPYVLINDLARFFITAVENGETDTVRGMTFALEVLGVSPDRDVRGLLTEFITGLIAGAGERQLASIAALRPLMGPATAETLASVERTYGVG